LKKEIGVRCPAQLSEQYDSTSSPKLLGSNSDMDAWECGLELHDVKLFDMVD